jgi:hypothetical protein
MVIGSLLLVTALVGMCGGSEGKAAGDFDVNSGFFLLFLLLPTTWHVVVWIKSRMFVILVLCCEWRFTALYSREYIRSITSASTTPP